MADNPRPRDEMLAEIEKLALECLGMSPYQAKGALMRIVTMIRERAER